MLRSYGTPFRFVSILFPGLKSGATIWTIPTGFACQSRRLGSYCRDGIYSIPARFML